MVDIYAGNLAAPTKGVVANKLNRAGDVCAGELYAPVECLLSDRDEIIREVDVGGISAVSKGLVSNGRNAIRDGDAREKAAESDRVVSYGGYWLVINCRWDNKVTLCELVAISDGDFAIFSSPGEVVQRGGLEVGDKEREKEEQVFHCSGS